MIWWVFSFSFFLFCVKDFIFFGEFFDLNNCSFFMVSLSPLVLQMIMMFLFPYFLRFSVFFYKMLYVMAVFSVSLTFMVSSLFLFYLFLEFSSVPMTLLILNFSKNLDKFSSLIFMIFTNFFGSLPFLFFSAIAEGKASSLFLSSFKLEYSSGVFLFFFLLLLVTKIPLFLLHFWLTKAHVSSAGSCSMLLASLMLKLGTFGLFKFSSNFVSFFSKIFTFSLALGLWGSLCVILVMLRFFDVKLLVACSSIVHMSFVFPFCFNPSSVSMMGILFMMVGHGLVSYFLFMMVSLVYEFSFNRSYDSNKSMESYSKILMFFFVLFSFLNLGVPPFLNFLSELYFCTSLFVFSNFSLFLLFLSFVLGVIFTMILVTKSVFGKKHIFYTSSSESLGLASASFFFFLFLGLYIFMFSYLFSLIKILFCGNKDLKVLLFSKSVGTFFLMFFCSFLMFSNLEHFYDVSLKYAYSSFSRSPILSMGICLDTYSLWFWLMVSLVTMLVVSYSQVYMEHYNNKKFLMMLTLFFLSMATLSFSNSWLILMMGWDGLGLSSIFLIMFYPNKTTLSNSMLTMFFNRLGDCMMIVIISHFICYFGNFYQVTENVSVYILFLILFCGFTKSAQFPLSSWLPAAMSAPTPISAMVHSSTLVTAGLFFLHKMGALFWEWPLVSALWFFFSGVTFILGGFMASLEMDFKKIVAFSTMSQISMMMICCSLSLVSLSLMHMLFHAFFKTFLFSCAGLMFMAHFSNQQKSLIKMSYSDQILMVLFFFSIFCMTGLLFSSSFFSKDLMLEILFSFSSFFFFIFFFVGSLFTLLYCSKMMEASMGYCLAFTNSSSKKFYSVWFMLFLFATLYADKIFKRYLFVDYAPLISFPDLLIILLFFLLALLKDFGTKFNPVNFFCLDVSYMKSLSYSLHSLSLKSFYLNNLTIHDSMFFKYSNLVWSSKLKFFDKFSLFLVSFLVLIMHAIPGF